MMLQRITTVKLPPHNAAVHTHLSTEHADPRQIIRRLMNARGFKSARELALHANVSQPSLARYLSGYSEDMEMATWRKLAASLDVTVSQLLGEVPIQDDRMVAEVTKAMRQLPEDLRAALAAAATALASTKP